MHALVAPLTVAPRRAVVQAGHSARLGAAIAAAVLWASMAPAGDDRPDDATPIATVKSLAPADLLAHPAFRIRGVVTWLGKAEIVVQDSTTAIYCHRPPVAGEAALLDPAIKPGVEVEVIGPGERGGFGPRLRIDAVRVLGPGTLPEPRDVDPERTVEGTYDTEFVRLTGVVLGSKTEAATVVLDIESQGRTFTARFGRADLPCDPADLVDAVVRVAGIAWPRANTRGESLGLDLSSRSSDRLEIVERPPAAAFESPRVAIGAIAAYSSLRRPGRRIQTEGTLIHAIPGEAIYLQDGRTGITVRCDSTEGCRPGDRVAVAGFPDASGPVVGLKHAVVRRLEAGPPPPPLATTPDGITRATMESWTSRNMLAEGDAIGCLVRFPATLVETRRTQSGTELLVRAGDTLLTAACRGNDPRLDRLLPESSLDVTGIVTAGWGRNPAEPPDRIGLLLRSADDVALVRPPSWWTPRRLLVALATIGGVLAGAVAWAIALRRQVAVQSTRLAGEIRKREEAAIEFRALAERVRLANNLHDTLLQGLAGTVLQLDACRFALLGGRTDAAESQLDKSKRMVQHAANDLRNSVWALRAAPLEGRTLGESIAAVADHVASGEAARVVIREDDAGFEMPEFVTGNLLFVAQEAIRNALHHGECSTVEVRVAFDASARTVAVDVRDDGRGFDPAAAAGTAQGHFGLQVMRERMTGMGGTLEIDTAPGRGTTVRATVVVEKA